MQLLKNARSFVFAHVIPVKVAAVHYHIYSNRKRLNKSQRTAHVKKPVGTAKFIRYHSAGKYYGFIKAGFAQFAGCMLHGIGAVRYYYFFFAALVAVGYYYFAVCIGHFQAVYHHQRTYTNRQITAPQF